MKNRFRILLIAAGFAAGSAAQAEIGTTTKVDETISFEHASKAPADGLQRLAAVIEPNLIEPAIPEPATTAWLVGGLVVIAAFARRRKAR